MTVTTVTSGELNQDVVRAKKAAKSGLDFISDRGKPTHILLSIEDYQRLAGQGRSLVEALSMPGLADIDFDPPRACIEDWSPFASPVSWDCQLGVGGAHRIALSSGWG